VFGEGDLAWIRYAVCLRSLGMGISEIARYVQAAHRTDGERTQLELLVGHLEQMREQRAELDHFIAIAEAKLASKGMTT
jgi:DNA-binding transcriptional MerR regulator